ncbi:uncharacterized protein LOC117522181 isoform X4 [Thalassophryne amazonica]|uniref:uncharacterized protein LOC117522181 isoform X4 n=1 Tax=Thalassophryne amazonica TaxID=390379 RepID=UPI001470898E|nr:uncharacterized protein LOC117522181 isoform X4 [Thalassophryne amazonica]
MLQQLVIKEEMLPEQQELNLSVDRKDIKLKQEEVWTSNKGQQLHRLETEKTKLHFVPVKTENDDEIPQSSQVLQNSDMLQQLVIKEEMLPEQQELNLSVDQKDIKQEQEEVWTSNEGQQLHRLETEKTKFLFVPVKTENDDEIPQSSQVLQNSVDDEEPRTSLLPEVSSGSNDPGPSGAAAAPTPPVSTPTGQRKRRARPQEEPSAVEAAILAALQNRPPAPPPREFSAVKHYLLSLAPALERLSFHDLEKVKMLIHKVIFDHCTVVLNLEHSAPQ